MLRVFSLDNACGNNFSAYQLDADAFKTKQSRLQDCHAYVLDEMVADSPVENSKH